MAATQDRNGVLAEEVRRLLETIGVHGEWADDPDNVIMVDVAGEAHRITVEKV